MANTSHDVWQFAIVLFVCLTGCLPWQKAASDDPRYSRYASWQNTSIPLKRQPKLFKLLTSKAQRLFKKYLEPKPEKRPTGLSEIHRFLEDRWLSRGGIEKMNEQQAEEEGLCPSMYSFHSSPEEKNKLLKSLTQYGLETTVDRKAKKDRIRQWIQTTVIEEETEEDLQEEYMNDEDIKIKDNQTGPIGERVPSRGPISEVKVRANGHLKTDDEEKKARRMSTSSLRKMSDVYIPPVDPRIPLEQQKNRTLPRRHVQFDETVQNKENEEQENGVDDNDTKNNQSDRRPSMPFSISSALPFQNLQITDSLTSIDSAQTSDHSNITKHKISIQLPQSEGFSFYSHHEERKSSHRGSLTNGDIGKTMNGNAITNGTHIEKNSSSKSLVKRSSRKSSRSPSK